MKAESRIFGVLTVFYIFISIVYGYFSKWEPVGTTALALSAGLAALVQYYTWFTGRRIGPRPEDRADGEIAEAAGEIGFFSPHSIWPLPLAGAFSLTVTALVYGWWLVCIGAGLLLLSVVGFLFEYQRGERAVH